MDLDREIVKLGCELYANFRFSRLDIQTIFTMISNFIKNKYNPYLLQMLCSNIENAVESEVLEEIKKLL